MGFNDFFQFGNQHILLQTCLLNSVGYRRVLHHHFTDGRFDDFEPAVYLNQLIRQPRVFGQNVVQLCVSVYFPFYSIQNTLLSFREGAGG